MYDIGEQAQADGSWLNVDTLYYETGSGMRYPLTILFDTGNITTTVTTKSGKEVSRNGGFGNFYGGFDSKKYDIEEEKSNLEWGAGVDLIEHDFIPQSQFSKELDGYDDEVYEKEQAEIRKQEEADRLEAIQNSTSASDMSTGYQNMFAEMMKQNVAAYNNENEEVIDTSKPQNEDEEKEPETPEQLYNKFDFKSNHRYFTDYMQCLLSDRSKIEIPQFNGSFALYSEGQSMLDDQYLLDDMTDEFRYLLEKTDNMQCLRLCVDTDTGFGSFAQRYLEEIKDEMPKKPIVLYSVTGFTGNVEMYEDERKSIVEELRGYNSMFSILNYTDLVTSYIPIDIDFSSQAKSFEALMPGFDTESLYHLSSIPALAINDLFMPVTKHKASKDMGMLLYPMTIYKNAKIHMNKIKTPFLVNNWLADEKFPEIVLSHQYHDFKSKTVPLHTQVSMNGLIHDKQSKTKLAERAQTH